MELRHYAEQVLFATTLEEKLAAPPGELTDARPGPALAAPSAPGRPAALRFKPTGTGERGDVPGLHRLEDDHERGRLLHFFANHELLATELMALVLLRFPEAPAAFRRGVLRTLRDEQEHTRLYLERMRACGVTFGEQPVSGYFWRCVAGMESPIDYVAGLSLTFEQANLDFARHFAQGFATVGDADTARLLDRIYRDEIGHVAYGLKWFRRWKHPGASDWEAFCRQLKFPLSPQRAKGLHFNAEGRRAAGLDATFVAEPEVYARSRGRTPGVYFFNPLAEAVIARGAAFTPARPQRDLVADLAHLPMFLGRQDDIVLVPQRPRREFLRDLQQAGFALPEFIADPATLSDRKLGRLHPWAWAPDSVAALAPLWSQVAVDARRPDEGFSPAIAALFSKSWGASFLRRFLEQHREPWLANADEAGVIARAPEEMLDAVAAIRRRGHHAVVVKEAFGLAGQNAIRLWEPEILPSHLRRIERVCAAGGEFVVEPWCERLLDFSLQAEMTRRGLELVGYTALETDRAGRFVANRAAPNFARRLPPGVATALTGPRDLPTRVHRLYEELRDELGRELQAAGYLGPVGVDAFVYRDAAGAGRLRPVVEVNPRYTMGRLNLELMRHVAPGSSGRFAIVNRATVRAAGAADFPAYGRRLVQEHPLQFVGEPEAKISAGVVLLSDPEEARMCLAVFAVTPTGHRTTP
jgi:uncharacterized ferritin-like protein (DUF455 family)